MPPCSGTAARCLRLSSSLPSPTLLSSLSLVYQELGVVGVKARGS